MAMANKNIYNVSLAPFKMKPGVVRLTLLTHDHDHRTKVQRHTLEYRPPISEVTRLEATSDPPPRETTMPSIQGSPQPTSIGVRSSIPSTKSNPTVALSPPSHWEPFATKSTLSSTLEFSRS